METPFRFGMTVAVLSALMVMTAVDAAAATAPAKRKAEARRLYSEAEKHYALTEYEEAIAKYRAAYRLVPEPVFLFNIAQAHRLRGDPAEALRFYRNYLDAAPDAPNRSLVEDLIARVELEVAEAAKAAASTSTGGSGDGDERVPGGTATGSSTPGPIGAKEPVGDVPTATAGTEAGVSPGVTGGSAMPAGRRRSVLGRWWFWTAVAGVVGAAVVGVVLATRGSDRGLGVVDASAGEVP